MDQQQVEAWIAANGGPGAVQYNSASKTIDNPAADPVTAKEAGVPFNPMAPPKITITEESWVNTKTGAVLRVSRQPDGGFQVIENKQADPNKPAPTQQSQQKPPGGSEGPEGTPTGRKNPDGSDEYDNSRPRWVVRDKDGTVVWARPLEKDEREQWEREKNGGKTDAEMRAEGEEKTSQEPVNNRPGWVQITRIKGNDKKVTFKGPDGREVETLPPDDANGSKQFVHTDGKTYYEITRKRGNDTETYISSDPEGKTRVTLPGKESRSVTQKRAPNGQVYYEVSVEKDGNKETYTASDPEGKTRIAPPGNDPMEGVKGVPSFTPDLTKPGAGLLDRAKQLDELLASGRITWDQRQRILEADANLAKQVAGEFNTATTLLREQAQAELTQRGQDMTQAGNRATLANTHHQNAIGVIEKFAPYLGVTPGDAGKMFMGMMASQLATATAYGGMQDTPRVQMDPRLGAFVDRTLAGPQAAPATVPPGPGEAPAADPQAAARAEAEAVRQAHRASGQPLPAPIFAPAPVTAPVQQAGNIPPGMMSPNPPDMTQTTAPATPQPTPGFIEQVDWGTTPLPQALATGEALFGRTLPPPPSSWRQDAEQQMFAMTAPNPQTYGTGAGLFGGSLPPAMTQAPGGMDYSLPPMAGGGGMDPIEAEARRQLAAVGVMV